MKKRYCISFIYLLVIGVFLLSAFGIRQTADVISDKIAMESRSCLILDAGHGGPDGGAVSCTGVAESKINLEICIKLDDLLHLLGYTTKLIRDSDISVYTKGETIAQKKNSDLVNRVEAVNTTPNAILISIHQNYFPERKYSGAQVFYAKTEGSHALAERMQKMFTESVNQGSRRQCKISQGIYLMEHINCTAVLVECGFLSNPEEEARLRDDAYQRKLCCIMATAAACYMADT